MSTGKVVIKSSRMSKEMEQYAMDCVTLAFIKHKENMVCEYTEVMCLVGLLVVNFRMLIRCLFSGYCKVYMR